MYVRWAEKRGYKVELQSEEAGAEAGIKSCAYKISGANAYGWLKSESGVHRLVRISPFGKGTRETSFASVWVYPVVDDNIEIEGHPSDIRIDTFRSSGAGGQHVNTTDSAVRINPPSDRDRCDKLGKIAAPEPRHRHEGAEIPGCTRLELERRTADIKRRP